MKKTTKAVAASAILGTAVSLAIYFLSGRKGKKNREKIQQWVMDMKADVLKKIKELKEIDKEKYEKIIEDTAKKYRRVARVSRREFDNVLEELKNAWKQVKKEIQKKN